MQASTLKAMAERLMGLGARHGGSAAGEDAAIEELEMELALLREENARLKVEQHRPPDAGRIVERMRHLADELALEGASTTGGEEQQAAAECLTIRDGLLHACQEIQQVTRAMRERLSVLPVEIGAEPEHAVAASSAQESGLELAAVEDSPELSERVA